MCLMCGKEMRMRKPNQYYKEVEALKRMTLLFKSMTKEQVGAYLKISEEEALKVMKAFGRMRRGYFDEGRECIAV